MEIPAECADLYATFGAVAEKAQLLEVDAGNVALYHLAFWFKPETITEDHRQMFLGVVRDLNRKTLGAIFRNLKTLATYDEKILDAVDEALKARNYLMHRFFPAHNFSIFDANGRASMIDELESIAGKIEKARGLLIGVCGCLEQMIGVRPEAVEELAIQLQMAGKKIKI